MKLELEPTAAIVVIEGVQARVWEGRTDAGVEVHALVVSVAVPKASPEECERFKRQLIETIAPRAQEVAPARWGEAYVRQLETLVQDCREYVSARRTERAAQAILHRIEHAGREAYARKNARQAN